PNARWNRALALLAVGRYREGFDDYQSRWFITPWQLTDERGHRLRRDLPQWRGEPLDGRRLVVIHEAGFGDTLMLLRYGPRRGAAGGEVALVLPPALQRIGFQLAPLCGEVGVHDVYAFMFDLPRLLDQDPATIPRAPYLAVQPDLQRKWVYELN